MKILEMMKRSTFIKHGSKMILKFDLSGLKSSEEVGRVVDYFVSIVEKMPKRSTLLLVDFRSLVVSGRLANDMIRLAQKCDPHMIATAIIVWDTSTRTFTDLLTSHVGNINMKVFREVNEAEGWLVANEKVKARPKTLID